MREGMTRHATSPLGAKGAGRGTLVAALVAALGATGCHRSAGQAAADAGPDGAPAQAAASAAPEPDLEEAPPKVEGPVLAITSFVGTVYAAPRDTSKKLGYLRVGTIIGRSEEPAGKSNCPGGWYEIKPRGFVCAGKDATTDPNDPVVRAAVKRPNLKTALPYRYAFVRAVLPLYLRVPSAAEQYKSEFKLKEHLEWFRRTGPRRRR
jgi:hypothetical protein